MTLITPIVMLLQCFLICTVSHGHLALSALIPRPYIIPLALFSLLNWSFDWLHFTSVEARHLYIYAIHIYAFNSYPLSDFQGQLGYLYVMKRNSMHFNHSYRPLSKGYKASKAVVFIHRIYLVLQSESF